ncbi:MAG: PKD domain-containing protein, partial [Thermoplasmata archaeon]|nr:PKD domain-containing protein [Thermoplasmata archaeon]
MGVCLLLSVLVLSSLAPVGSSGLALPAAPSPQMDRATAPAAHVARIGSGSAGPLFNQPSGGSLVRACQSARDAVACIRTLVPVPANVSANATWTNLTTAPQPPDLLESTIAYDEADGYVVLFGGFLDGTNLTTNQTWKFQDAVWTNLTATAGNAPSPRFGMSMTYDGADHYLLAHGGYQKPGPTLPGVFPYYVTPLGLNDTWKFVAGTWSPLNVTCDWSLNGTSYPAPSCETLGGNGNPMEFLPTGSNPMVYDARDGYVLMDDSWTYSNGTWTMVYGWPHPYSQELPSGTLESLAYDAADGAVVAFGSGGILSADVDYDSWVPAPNNYTFLYQNSIWTNISANLTISPPSRLGAGLTYDSEDGYVILYGGYVSSCLTWTAGNCTREGVTDLSDTWGFHNGSWTNLTPVTSPGPREQPQIVDDLADRTVLIEAGAGCVPAVCDYPEGSWCWPSYTPPEIPVQYLCTGAAIVRPSTWVWGATPPLAGVTISESASRMTAGALVLFSSSFLGGSPTVSFAWNFGDGSLGVGQNVSHRYAHAGAVAITVWVNDTAGYSQNRSEGLFVNPVLGLNGSATPDPTDVGLPVAFAPGTVNGTPPYFYRWTFGDGGSSTDAAPAHTYRANGTFVA